MSATLSNPSLPAGDVLHVDDETFGEVVLASSEPILVDFGATWCGPCKALEPVVRTLAREQAGRARVAKLDVDDSPQVAARYGVRSLPTVLVFKGGQVVGRHVGLTTKEKLRALLDL